MGVTVAGRRGWPGASENVACGSRITVARRSAAARTAGIASSNSACASAIRSAFVRSAIGVAPLDTTERCDASSPKTVRLSKTHCMARPGRPMNGSSITCRSNHRFTVTIGDEAMARARSSVSVSAVACVPCTSWFSTRSGNANHGTAEIAIEASKRSPTASTDVTRSS